VLVIAAILIWNRQLKNLSEKRGKELFRERSASAIAELKTEERTRLAAEIHDSISQILTGAAMQLDAGEIQAAKRILASCRRELRACLWDLRSHALDAENFSDAIKETLVSHMNGRSASIEIDIPSSKMSERLRHAALCIIREAVVNAIRHGRAETIAISGDFDGHNLVFSIVDDGKGFNPTTARGSKDGHFGLLGMRERAKAFKGSVTISSSSGNGTEIAVVLEDHDENEQG
jgi:signal transduction histidine kinase